MADPATQAKPRSFREGQAVILKSGTRAVILGGMLPRFRNDAPHEYPVRLASGYYALVRAEDMEVEVPCG